MLAANEPLTSTTSIGAKQDTAGVDKEKVRSSNIRANGAIDGRRAATGHPAQDILMLAGPVKFAASPALRLNCAKLWNRLFPVWPPFRHYCVVRPRKGPARAELAVEHHLRGAWALAHRRNTATPSTHRPLLQRARDLFRSHSAKGQGFCRRTRVYFNRNYFSLRNTYWLGDPSGSSTIIL